MATVQQILDIVHLFTAAEARTLRPWFDLDLAGHDIDADRLLRAGLDVEHFISRLNDDPNLRTAEQLAKLQELEENFHNELALADGILQQDRKQGGGRVALTRDEYAVFRHFFGLDKG